MRKHIDYSEWSRKCPSCDGMVYYSNKYKLESANTAKSVCGKCKYEKISFSLTGKKLSAEHRRSLVLGWGHRKERGYVHPMLNKHHSEETRRKMILAKQEYNPWKGKHHSETTKQRMSELWKVSPRDMSPVIAAAVKHNTGKTHSPEHNLKISIANKGRKCSDVTKLKISQKILGLRRTEETREKLRIAKLIQLKDQGISRGFNRAACSFMERLNKNHGFQFIHAENGGEVMIGGYMVDGYDREKNIVFEYDEPKHENFNRKAKDLQRTSSLIQKSGCKVLRYSERYNRFYWSYPEKSEIFILQ